MCPQCHSTTHSIKRGFYTRPSDQKRIQRFYCRSCHISYSTQTQSFDYRLRKRRINQSVFRLLSKGLSQRATAETLQVDPKTIARRLTRFGKCAKSHLDQQFLDAKKVESVVFDEMESFEHTKLKPLTIPLAIEDKTRMILAVEVAPIAAKGHLAELSKKKYGKRSCGRKEALTSLFTCLKTKVVNFSHFKSDESKHYPKVLKSFFPHAVHRTYKGRKAAVIGQGEMKKGGHDPLFYLNQTAAMIRDNIKTMTRKTWCTTKRPDRLLDLLHLYSFYHNQRISGVRRPMIFNAF